MTALSKRRKRRKAKRAADRHPTMLPINRNIRRLREKRGFDRDVFGAKFGITGHGVAKWETGWACPPMSKLPDVAAELGVSVDELLAEVA